MFAAMTFVAGGFVFVFTLFAKHCAFGIAQDFALCKYFNITRRAAFLFGPLLLVLGLMVIWLRDRLSLILSSFAQRLSDQMRYLGQSESQDPWLLRPRLKILFVDRNEYSENIRSVLVVLGLNFISFVALSYFAFRINEPHLFYGLDGSYMMELFREQIEWLPLQPGFSNNFLQSLGNVWFPLNVYLIPGYAVSMLNAGKVDPAVSYTIFASELFLATLSLGLFLRLRPILATAAAWALCLVTFPYIEFSTIYPIMVLVPHFATLVMIGIFLLILFWMIGKKNAVMSCACIIGVLLLMIHVVLSESVFTILIAPVLVVFGLFGLIYSGSRYERLWKLIASGLIVATLTVSGCVPYVYGLSKYTAAYFFQQELFNDRMQLQFVSVLFTSRGGFILFTLCLIGALIVALRGSGLNRVFAKATLFSMNLILISGVISKYFNIWHGPSPLYFEFLLWPLYAVFGSIALGIAGVYGLQILVMLFGITSGTRAVSLVRSVPASFFGLAVAILPWMVLGPALSAHDQKERDYPYLPVQTPIVATLAKQISLKPGEIFRGRAATFTGQGISAGVNWFTLHTMDHELIKRFGNDHRMVGLWYYDIPTLMEYSPLITPAFYLITRYFLARSGDVQMRNVMTLRDINPRLLRMLGVRFLITDAPLADFAHLRERIPEHGYPRLFLYELDGVNVGQFSPHEAILASDASTTLMALSRSGFDPAREIVVQEPLPKNLSPLTKSQLTAEVGALRISALSGGTSVILLPLEYSHCLELKPISRTEGLPKLFRANLVQVGILFDRELDAVVTYFTGPFHNAGCRLEDARDMQRLDVTAAPSARP